MIPHYSGSERLGNFMQEHGLDHKRFESYRKDHLKHLEANHPVDLAENAL